MRVIFRTNIDHYNRVADPFPNFHDIVPRKGDTVLVRDNCVSYFSDRKLPLGLEVVDVKWCEAGVICELHYRQIDIEAAKISKVSLF